jgi:putative transposase
MRKSRFTEEQIIKVLKQRAARMSAGDLCRKHGISDATFYKWRSRYGGMEVKLRALENRKLKKLPTESILNGSTPKEMLEKTSDARLAEESCDLVNGNITKTTPRQLYHAKLAASDPNTTAIAEVCSAAGVAVLRRNVSQSEMTVGQTQAVG